MLKKIKFVVILFLAGLMTVAPVASFANPAGKITAIKKHQKAPFDGTLFDIKAAADLTLRLEGINRQCEIRIDKEVGLARAKLSLDLNLKIAEYDALAQRYNDVTKIKNDQIDFLQKVATKDVPWYKTSKFWFATGIVTGFVVSLGSAYAWGQVAQ